MVGFPREVRVLLMRSSPRNSPLIEISIRSLKVHPFFVTVSPRPMQAVVVAVSTQSELSFEIETGGLNAEMSRRCHLLQQHGFTVVEFSDDKYEFQAYRDRWQEATIQEAMEKIASLYPGVEEISDMPGYDPKLAMEVLTLATKAFPNQVRMAELKFGLSTEPTTEALFTAIAALEADAFVEAKMMRGQGNQIVDVAYIRATREGRDHLKADIAQASPARTFIQSQINTYGPVGAIGSHSHGVLNIQNQHSVIEHVDLNVLAMQLEQLRAAYRQTSTSREDDRQVALIDDAAAAAERGDRHKVASFL
jgi:hypothetical protein